MEAAPALPPGMALLPGVAEDWENASGASSAEVNANRATDPALMNLKFDVMLDCLLVVINLFKSGRSFGGLKPQAGEQTSPNDQLHD